jgi:type VI secretion system protein ImpL
MSPIWLIILVLIVLLVLGTSLFLYFVLRRARKISFSADPGVKAEADKKEQAPAEFLHYATNLDLRSSFSRALRLLKQYVTGTDYRYRVPWFLMTGESESGKTTLLDGNGVNLSADGSDLADQPINWYFFNEGVVLDVAGDFVLRTDLTSDHRGWNTISRLLQKHRPRRPLDGIVLTIPCTDLVGPANLSNERRFRLEQKAICLYKKLWQSQRILGMRLPVYIVLTRCNEVTGFTSFCNQLPDRLQTQMFGWSNPSTLETAYKPDFIPQAFESLHKYLSHLQFEIYAERDEIHNADDLFLVPSAIQSMRAPLQVYLDGLFKQSAYHESYFFRGLYFCGEVSEELVAQPVGARGLEDNWAENFEPFEPAPPEKIESFDRNSIFVSDLFKEKIFAEDFLAQPIKRVALSRNRTVLAAQILSLFILLVGGGGLAVTYPGLSQQEKDLYAFLTDELADLKKVETLYGQSNRQPANISQRSSPDNMALDELPELYGRMNVSYQFADYNLPTEAQSTDLEQQPLHGGEAKLLTLMTKMKADKFDAVFIPSSWFSSINERLEKSIATAFTFVIFESLRADLERRETRLLQMATPAITFGSALNLDRKDRIPSFDLIGPATQTVDRNFQLPLFIEQLGELRVNLDRYEKLINKDSGNLDDLNHLVEYLQHAPLPTGFDKENDLYKRALKDSQGRPIEARLFFRESANKVAERIEDLYELSFNQRGVKYDCLDEITETEALLRRPEYTWLSTFVIDPHSAFHGMTISSALVDLKQALQDLRRQRFMTRDAPDETGDQPRYQHRVRSVLVWDQETLRQALAVNDQYESFIGTKSYEPSERLDTSVREAARARAKLKIRNLIVRARKYQALAPSAEGSALRASLITEVGYLQTAQPVLTRVLEVSARLGIDRELRAALSEQGTYLLRGIYREFMSQQFYVAKQGSFSWWDGRQPVSYHTYDLGSPEDLAAYLNFQRKNIAFLGRDLVVPVLTFFASQNIYVQRSDSQVDWDEILADLDAFDNKTPGNPIAALETFIRAEMDRVSIDSCAGSVRLTNESSNDYFLRIRNSLRLEFYARCTELARIKAINDALAELKNYGDIEKSFNENLAGGFPFSNVNGPPLDPWAMLKFFRVLDSKEKAARDALNRSADFGAAPQRATEFLDQMDRVHEFFGPFLEKKQGPVFDFRVQFRVKPEQPGQAETGGNQIIDWRLEVGKKKFAYLSDDLTGRWIYGDPIRVTLRWANDSPSRPVPSALPVPFIVKERTAVFEYNDRWSLFTFLLRHGLMLKRAGATAECDQGYDADPYTLKFTMKTEPDPAGLPTQAQDLKSSPAEVFMRVSMLTANKPEPLMLPCFPTKAPPVPSLFVEGKIYATNKDE